MSINSFRGEVEAISYESGVDDSELFAERENRYNHNTKNGFTGTLGALLFALGGGILWFLIYQTGFIVGLAGVATVAFAIYGYTIFGNGLSKFGIAVSVIIAVAIIFFSRVFLRCKGHL